MKILKFWRLSLILLAAGSFTVVGLTGPLLSAKESCSERLYLSDKYNVENAKTIYTVRKGDTLAKIAKKVLGFSDLWRQIAKANPRIRPERMEVGTKLIIPDLTPIDNSSRQQSPVDLTAGNVDEKENASDFPPDYAFLEALLPGEDSTVVKSRDNEKTLHADNYSKLGIMSNTLKSQFRGMEFELPENLKPDKISPYFVNARGLHGLFNTESALFPNIRTLDLGLSLRFDKYKESPYQTSTLTGSQWVMPLNLLFLRNRLMVGASVPVQSWEVQRSDIDSQSVSMSGLHDPSVRVGYQVWTDTATCQAISLHFSARIPSGNYHQPKLDMTDKTKDSIQVGPAAATRGGWLELGGAYSRKLTDRWNTHFNLELASNPRDRMSRISPRGTLEYTLDENCVLLTELNGDSWIMEKGPDGTNLDVLLGVAWFTPRWQFSLGVPINVQSDWGYKHDIGLQLGMNFRQD